MQKSKAFKLHFYTLQIDDTIFGSSHDQIVELLKLLNKGTKPSNVYKINGYQAFVKTISNNIYCFEKHRIDDLPSVGSINTNVERNLDLKAGETLIEKNYFFINKESGYIVYQEKNEGFRASSLGIYFQYLTGVDTGKIEISQILKTTAYQRLAKYGYLKGMEISLASPNNKMLSDFGISLNDRIMYTKDKNINVSLRITLNQKDTFTKSFIKNLSSTYNKYSDKIGVFKVRGSETENGLLEDINLANDVIEATADVRVVDNHIVEDDMINSLTHADTVYNKEIIEILEE